MPKNPAESDRWFVLCPETGVAHGPFFTLAAAENESELRCGDHTVHVDHVVISSDPGLDAIVLPPITLDMDDQYRQWAVLWICQRRDMIQGELL